MKYLFILAMLLIPALANAQSLVNPTLVNPTITSRLNAGNGMQSATVGTCQTTAVQYNCCNTTLTWPVPFVDTNYLAICTCLNPQNYISSFAVGPIVSASSITFTICTLNSNVTACTADCVGIHN